MSAPEILTGRCTQCGGDVHRDISGLQGFVRDVMTSVPLVCETCIAAGEAESREAEERRERALARRRREARVTASGVPAELLGIGFDDIDRTGRELALDAAVRWANGELAGLLFVGPVGSGKTRLAAAAANTLLARRALRWTSAPLLMARLGSGMGSDAHDRALDMLIGTQPLVLDDLDKARATEYAAEHLFAAIDTRMTEGIPLLVTTNLGTRHLQDKWPGAYGHAITSRLAGYCEGHRVDGPDRRITPVQHDRGGGAS